MLVETQYFPPTTFWAKALQTGEILVEKQENYQKRSYRNKCEILGANNILTLSIPLEKGKNTRMPITSVKISNIESWRSQHLSSIKSAYGSAPYFEFYWKDISDLISNTSELLYDFNYEILSYFCKLFNISISETEEYVKSSDENDLRQKITPKSSKDIEQSYEQVFTEKHGWVGNLSIIDPLFCLGPECKLYLKRISQ